jgi:hypothetical protein
MERDMRHLGRLARDGFDVYVNDQVGSGGLRGSTIRETIPSSTRPKFIISRVSLITTGSSAAWICN